MVRRSLLHELCLRNKTHISLERFEVIKSLFWSCSKLTENGAASSLWIGGHRYTGIKFVSKLVWVYSDLKLGHHFGQFSIPKRFTKELVLRQNLPLQFFSAQELTYIKIRLSTIEDLYLGYHLLKFHNLC